MIAASPNWRSRSSSSVLLPIDLHSVAARFVETTVLPTPPFGEKTVITRPRRPSPALRAAALCAGLADGEDDVLRQLRQRDEVGDAVLERLFEQAGAVTGREEDDRRTRVLAHRRQLSRWVLRPTRRVEDRVEVAAGECRGRLLDHLGRSDELELVVGLEGLEDLWEPVAGARDVDAEPFFAVVLVLGHVSLLTR